MANKKTNTKKAVKGKDITPKDKDSDKMPASFYRRPKGAKKDDVY